MNSTRRDWILGSLGSSALAAIASAHEHASQAVRGTTASQFEFFDAATAADLAAIAAQILPSMTVQAHKRRASSISSIAL
jgi:hypothetical protein